MGYQYIKAIKTQEERRQLVHYLLQDIKALERMLKEGIIEKNTYKVGAEQEFCIVDSSFRPSFNALKILELINDSHFTTELGLFNLEINLDPHKLTKTCFSEIKNQLNSLLQKAYKAAKKVNNNKIILTGILPTLSAKDLVFENMTPLERYLTLNSIFTNLKKEDFRLYIKGVDELFIKHKTILLEACNTSFQIHLQIDPDEAVSMYNWAQMISGPVLAVSSNSPLLMGRELWSETRVALFQQSVDVRNATYLLHEERPRVGFGAEWITDSIVDVYKDDVARYPALITSDEICEDSMQMLDQGKIPELLAINLHNGTLYKWNRLCYGVQNNAPHLRIENRYIPSGPTVDDEIANMIFWVGLMQGMPKEYNEIWKKVPFNDARLNFNNAARTGLNTTFNWFNKAYSTQKLLIDVLLPMSEKGLKRMNIDKADIKKYLQIITDRIVKNVTGSKWQSRSFRKLKESVSKDEANVIITAGIYTRQRAGMSVIHWEPIKVEEGKDIPKKYDTVGKVMLTELFAVNENDPVRLVKKIVKWKNIHQLPVVNNDQNIVGVITSRILNRVEENDPSFSENMLTKEVMSYSVIMITSDTSVKNALKTIERQNVNCLLVMENNQLVGIFNKELVSDKI